MTKRNALDMLAKPVFTAIPGLVLLVDFVTRDEEFALIRHVDAATWDTSLKRRTQHYGYAYNYVAKSATRKVDPIPEWCDFLIDRLPLIVRPDQMIVNEYEPGQGIYPHVDNIQAFGAEIASVSLAADIIMDFRHGSTTETVERKLARRSALILTGDARYKWRHGITARKYDGLEKRDRRISLTFRKLKE